jgi:4-hydroxy-2-oxoglutarate aldolase
MGEGARAGRAQERLAPLARGIVAALGVSGVKAALDQVGLHGGAPRLPLLPLRDRDRLRVRELLATAGLAGTT